MLSERFVSQALERRLRLAERSLPALIRGKLFKDGRRKLFLLPLREAGGGFERFSQSLRHGCDSAIDSIKSRSEDATPTVNICAELEFGCVIGWSAYPAE